MVEGKIGDRVVLESERTGRPAREGEIIGVLGAGEGIHYHVRWDDGHESTFFPGGGVSIIHKANKERVPQSHKKT